VSVPPARRCALTVTLPCSSVVPAEPPSFNLLISSLLVETSKPERLRTPPAPSMTTVRPGNGAPESCPITVTSMLFMTAPSQIMAGTNVPIKIRETNPRTAAMEHPFFMVSGAASGPNDPKLSDGGGWRDGCTGAGGGAASVTAGAVRCSAWLGALRDPLVIGFKKGLDVRVDLRGKPSLFH